MVMLMIQQEDALKVLTDLTHKKKAVFIPAPVKKSLQDLCNEFQDIKMNYFAGNAITKAIEEERKKRNV